MNFRFENPQAFIFLWMLPVLWVLAFATARWARRKLEKSLGPRLSPFLTRSVSAKKRKWKWILRSAAVFCAVIALARPQVGESKEEIRSEGVEILLAVDVSDSMMAEDVRPNRLEQAKIELSKLMDLMPGNKTGVIAFAGSAALLSPLTNDPAAVKMYIDSLTTESVSAQGTCFECALSAAADAFERGGASEDESVKVTRVVLIASDGEDQEPGALEAAKKLAEKGTRIFTVAYGTEKGGSIPVRDGMGYLRGYKKDRGGQVVVSQVKGDFLRRLASAGRGSFVYSTSGGDHVKDIVADLDKLEKAQFETQIATQYDERFQAVLLIGVLLALLEMAVGERRGGFRLWKGRFEVPPA